MEAIIFWWPGYRLAGAIKLMTALVSWATVMALVPVTPQVLAMRSPEELEREIAARRQAEAALQAANGKLASQVEDLQKSELRFRLFVESTKDYAIFWLDEAGNVASWNSGAQRLLQYQSEEMMGRHVSCFYPAEDAKAGQPGRELVIAATEGRYEDVGWRIRKDGTRFWANVVLTALRDDTGTLYGFSKIIRDMTETKRAEEHAHRLLQEEAARKAAEEFAEVIRDQREQLRVTLHSIGDAVIVTDADGDVTLLNPMAESLTGWTSEDAEGQPLQKVFSIVNEQAGEVAEDPVARALREGRIVGLANHTVLIAKDGKRTTIDDSAAPIRDGQGQVIGAVLVFRDITVRKRLELKLQERADQLAEADRRKTEFLATLAHELRNPLAPIHNALQILRMSNDSVSTIAPMRDMMERQLAQLVRLVDDLMDVSRITRGKFELRQELIDLAAVVQSAVETSRPLIDEAKHVFQFTDGQEPLPVLGDLTRLAQVLSNLLNNAAKYTPPGGHIWLEVERNGSEAVIRVRDDGIGIPREMLSSIFDMFTQVDRSLTRTHSGLGIGLTLVRSLVEMHGGRVEAHSDGVGRGAEFVVRLQLAAASVKDHKDVKEANDLSASPRRRRVLVVDDNVDSADSLAVVIEMMGHEVRMAHAGPRALDLAAEFMPEVVLLDIGLPGMDGHEVARRLRTMPGLDKVMIIAQSGWGQEDDLRRSQEAGINEHLVKPVDHAALLRVFADMAKTHTASP